MIEKGASDKGFIWNPSNCEYEFDRSCDVGEYLYYKSCKCRKRLVDRLVEECNENIDEEKLAKITSTELHTAKDENIHKCGSCTLSLCYCQ